MNLLTSRPLAVAAALAAASTSPTAQTRFDTSLSLGGSSYAAEWWLPQAAPAALVTVQHGFTRQCRHVRATARALAAEGLATLCLNAPMAGGNPALAEALAAELVSGIGLPDGRAMPSRLVVGGHSAGGLFASRVGWALAAQAPQRLAGAVLFDPVDAADQLRTNLQSMSASGARAVLAITANASACNADQNHLPALRQVQQDAIAAGRDGFVGLQLTDRSTHVDVEGEDTTALAVLVCRQGRPRDFNTSSLRQAAARWALDMAGGSRSEDWYPGGAAVQQLIDQGRAALID
jgi:pimeloyl-ACP methyl ester carboxylesterase